MSTSEADKALRAALERMVYEATHLSPCKPNGDHDCTIKADALQQAREALSSSQPVQGEVERLREALKRIEMHDDLDVEGPALRQNDRHSGACSAFRICADIARTALTDTPVVEERVDG